MTDFAQPSSGSTIFSGYFNDAHKKVYGEEPQPYGAQNVNQLMLQRQQAQGGGQQKKDGPMTQAADAYGNYKSAMQIKDAMTAADAATPAAADAATPVAADAATPVAADAATSEGTAAVAGESFSPWWVALAALVAGTEQNTRSKGYHDKNDIFDLTMAGRDLKGFGVYDKAEKELPGSVKVGKDLMNPIKFSTHPEKVLTDALSSTKATLKSDTTAGKIMNPFKWFK